MNKKIIPFLIFVLFLNLSLISANENNFNETKQLIDSGIGCDELTDEQLEAIGDYYMEQMHPGESHELMDQMMGGEGSESLKQVHINMAKRLYCNEDVGGMMGGNMMGYGGMMGGNTGSYGMMGNWNSGFSYWNFLNILYLVLLIGIIVLIIVWIIKLLKGIENKRGRK